eukprot:1271460-Lingulodinium_polyedra.AAC.1
MRRVARRRAAPRCCLPCVADLVAVCHAAFGCGPVALCSVPAFAVAFCRVALRCATFERAVARGSSSWFRQFARRVCSGL